MSTLHFFTTGLNTLCLVSVLLNAGATVAFGSSVSRRTGPKTCTFLVISRREYHTSRSIPLHSQSCDLRMGAAGAISQKARDIIRSLRTQRFAQDPDTMPSSLPPKPLRWRGASSNDDVGQSAPVGVQRVSSMSEQMIDILRPDLRQISLAIFWALVGTFASLASPLAYSGVVAAVIAQSPAAANAAIMASPSLANAIAFLGLTYTVEPIATFLFVRSMSDVIDRAATRLKVQAFRCLLAQEVAFFDLMGSTELSAAVTADIRSAKDSVQRNLQRDRGLRAVLETVGGVGLLLKLCPQLGWLFGLVVPVASWALVEAGKRRSQLMVEEGKSLAMESAIASEAVHNIREVRGFGAEPRELVRFQAAARNSSAKSKQIGASAGRLEALNRVVINVCIVCVLSLGGVLVRLGSISAPLLLSCIGFCFGLNFAMQGVNYTLADMKSGQEALRRVFKVMKPAAKDTREGVDVISPREFQGRIDFRKVHFTYPTRPDKSVFSGLDLTLPAGEITALVGYSGGGKSTIAALLSGFYTPTQGEILIDGLSTVDLDRRWLTQRMALVGQNPALFTGTIAQNIAYGLAATTPTRSMMRPAGDDVEAGAKDSLLGDKDAGVGLDLGGVSMEKVVEAAEFANAKEFIEEFPDGFNTFIGERGVQLSGGQRQRIAIARAVLKDARILLLDEATSALDAKSEALVQEALSRLMKHRTVLVIAHRLSTVVNADKICVLSHGKVIEEGTHADLLARKGAYSQLMSTQVRSFNTIAD